MTFARRTLLFIAGCLLVATAVAGADGPVARFAVPSADVGTSVALKGKWLFQPGPPAAEAAVPYRPVPVPQMLSRIQWWLDDSEDFKKWEQARLDALGFDTEHTDEGTYRLTFDLPKDWTRDRHLWAEFDGVAMKCKVACNGHDVGDHAGMFSRFAFDLTPHLNPAGQPNTLSVWVSMEKIPPTAGNLGQAVTVNLSAAKVISLSKGMFGPLTPNQDNRAYDLFGIWQPVKLVVRGDAKIDDVFFRPTLNGATFTVESSAAEPKKVRARLTDLKTGRPFLDLAVTRNGDTTTFGAPNLSPNLWTPADPNLYRLDVTLEDGTGAVLDRWSHDVGFRTFEAKGNQLYLNGHPYWLRGANQLPYGKNPWDERLPRKLIQLMHDGNQRFTRTHATPWNEAWLDAADEIGLAVSIEGIRPWALAGKNADPAKEVMPPPEIVKGWMAENADVVRRCRNHPSVVIFTVGNEMLLRDGKNLKKWQILSDVTKQTRQLAPDRPIVCSSDYVRDPKFYESTLKPAGIDDGDLDDLHNYTGWYAPSVFVNPMVYAKELANNARKRPLIGQEVSTGYPDLDTGLPVLRYTRDLLTPQAWVGVRAYPGSDPATWLTEYAKVTQRTAEELRHRRGHDTAGFALFSAECWYHHSYDPDSVKPYPVYDAVEQAWAPVGIALETNQRRFYAGDQVATHVLVTNDDDAFRDFDDLEVFVGDTFSGRQAVFDLSHAKLPHLAYGQTVKVPVRFRLENTPERDATVTLAVRLVAKDGRDVAKTTDAIEIFPVSVEPPPAPSGNVAVVRRGDSLADLAPGRPLYEKVAAGATAIVFSPSADIVKLFPNDVQDVKTSPVEYADWYPVRGTALAQDLHPMDLKWWARRDDPRAFIAPTSHRLKKGGHGRELLRYIPPHSYIAAEKVPDQYRTVLSEIPVGKGRLWLCDLDLDASRDVDPAAALFARNLYRAAADPASTGNLPDVPSHEQLLHGAAAADAR